MVQSILEQRLFSRVRTLMEILECKACHGIKRFPCIHVSMRILSILAASAPLTISAYGCRGLSPNAPLQDSGSQELRTSPQQSALYYANVQKFSRNYVERCLRKCIFCPNGQIVEVCNARQLSLYWEGDLRKPSYFLNKRKELEFFI